MADNVNVEVDARETIKNLKNFADENRDESIKIVDTTAKAIKKRMKQNVRPHVVTGNLLRSITIKQTRPKVFRPIAPDERKLFKSVHPRNRKAQSPNKKTRGGHSQLLDYGTWVRETKRPIGKWGRNRGKVSGINFRERAREAETGEFKSLVRKLVNRDKTV